MSLLILNQTEIRQLLPMGGCIDLMREAFRALARGETIVPLRPVMKLPDRRGVLALMPGFLSSPESLGVKVITVFPGNLGTPLDAHQGAVLLFDTSDGRLIALMDASEVTAIRTAAATAVATDLLANRRAQRLAILGTGVQAHSHLEAMLAVRPITRVRVWSRAAEHAREFARHQSERLQVSIEACATARDAVGDADIICTVTAARDPVLQGEWIPEGTHLNAVGSASPTSRELDTAALSGARLYVDSRESAMNEAGDLLIPLRDGAVGEQHILGEIGELLEGRIVGRASEHDITLFKSLGLAVQDVIVADHLYHKARASGTGTEIEFGGRRP